MANFRVLQIVSSFPPAPVNAGAPLAAFELSRRLVLRGHEVTVLTSDNDDKEHRLSSGSRVVDGINVRYFANSLRFLESSRSFCYAPSLNGFMRKEVKRFDIVHCHDFRAYPTLVAHRYAVPLGVPYVLHTHGNAYPFGRGPLKRTFDIVRGYRILADASKVIAISEVDAHMGVPDHAIAVIPNGFDCSRFSALPARGSFRRKHGINGADKLVLCVNGMRASNGIDLLVKAMARLLPAIPETRLAVVGQDEGFLHRARQLVSQLRVEQNVIFTGLLSEAEKLSAYADADACFAHSTHGSPIYAILEAWACGLPVVTTEDMDTVVRKENIDKVAGLIVPYEADSLKAALYDLFTKSDLSRTLGANGRRIAEGWDTWEVFTDKVEQQYFAILDRERRIHTVAKPSGSPIKVSVIATVKNESENIVRMLDSLVAQSRKPDEVIIADGGSTDGTVEIINSYIGKYSYIRMVDARGSNISQGRNIATAEAKYEYIAPINGDYRADSDWLKNLLRPFEEDSNVDIVSCTCEIEARNELQTILRDVMRLKYRDENRAKYLPLGVSIAFKKEAWKLVGGYPEWLEKGEDSLFHTQLRKAGFKFALARDARVTWAARSDLKQLFRQYYSYSSGDAQAGTITYVGNTGYLVNYLGYIMRAMVSSVGKGKISSLYWGPLVAFTQLFALLFGRTAGFRNLFKRN